MTEKSSTLRTEQQNKALHLYFTLLAEELNAAGLTVQATLKPGVELDWTPGLIKEVLWRQTQKALLKKRSTTELNKQQEIDLIYDTINRHLSERFPGLPHVPFPSLEYFLEEK